MRSTIDALAAALYHHLANAEPVTYRFRDQDRTRALREEDLEIAHFRQNWPNTAAMFTGVSTIAGQGFTDAWTTVIWRGDHHSVYCDGRRAYQVDRPNEAFLADLAARTMADQRTGSVRYHDEGDPPILPQGRKTP